jgi:hypothetical protein
MVFAAVLLMAAYLANASILAGDSRMQVRGNQVLSTRIGFVVPSKVLFVQACSHFR